VEFPICKKWFSERMVRAEVQQNLLVAMLNAGNRYIEISYNKDKITLTEHFRRGLFMFIGMRQTHPCTLRDSLAEL
jgi:hypothetical protein